MSISRRATSAKLRTCTSCSSDKSDEQLSGCISTTNAHSETGQMAVCYQNLPLGALSRRSAPAVLIGELFKKFGLFLNTGVFRNYIFWLRWYLYFNLESGV